MLNRFTTGVRRLRRATRGVAMVEFAFILPIFLTFSLTGAELINYIVTRMRVSQMALQLADNMARAGDGTQLQAKKISEKDINDVLTGTGLQSAELDLYHHGRAIIYDIEPMANPNTNAKYKIGWQRCSQGGATYHAPSYGVAGQASGTNQPGYGPTNQLITAPDGGATILVEIFYEYTPLVKTSLSPSTTMTETASMMVRDRRDLSDDSATTNQHPNGIYKVNGVTASTC